MKILTLDVIPPTLEHPRNDWPMIFPLNDGSLKLVWCEYHTTTDDWDDNPCQISSRISTDQGLSWGETSILQETVALNVKHPNLLRLASDPNEILFFYTIRHNQSNDIRIYMERSQDELQTWSEPV